MTSCQPLLLRQLPKLHHWRHANPPRNTRHPRQHRNHAGLQGPHPRVRRGKNPLPQLELRLRLPPSARMPTALANASTITVIISANRLPPATLVPPPSKAKTRGHRRQPRADIRQTTHLRPPRRPLRHLPRPSPRLHAQTATRESCRRRTKDL